MSDSYYVSPKSATLAATYDATIDTSTTVTFNAATAVILVSATLKGIFMKWGGTASSLSFDEFISPDKTAEFVIPNNPATGVKYTTAQFIEEAASAHLVVIEK